MNLVVRSQRRATLTISERSGDAEISFSPKDGSIFFGINGQPAFELEPGFIPDDAWSIGSVTSGAMLESGGKPAPALVDFLGADLAEESAPLLSRIPDGTYELAISRPTPREGPVLLGNDWVEGESNIATMDSAPDFYAAALGRSGAPDLRQSMVAGVILNYTGQPTPVGLLFANLRQPSGSLPAIVLVIPASGALVHDALASFVGHDTPANLAWWEPRAALAADRLADWATPRGDRD